MITIQSLDHIVLTVASIDRSIAFYQRVAGMAPMDLGNGRRALGFGDHKINLHQAGREFEPKAATPTPGSGDFCLLVEGPMEQLLDHLAAEAVAIELGPVMRAGARGPINSVYIRDPDDNLVELSVPVVEGAG